MATLVKFLVNESHIEKDIFAYFPQLVASRGKSGAVAKLSYSYLGQHSGCSPQYAKESRKATQSEYLPLLNELKSIGYTNLKICK